MDNEQLERIKSQALTAIYVTTLSKIVKHLRKQAEADPRKRERLRARVALRTIDNWMVESAGELTNQKETDHE